jgi:hypothetical protein
LQLVDLSATQLRSLGEGAFVACGLMSVSVPAFLEELDASAFDTTPLKALDLSSCAKVKIVAKSAAISRLEELGLPREGFADLAKAFLPYGRVVVLHADVGAMQLNELLSELAAWGIEKLRVVSPRMLPYEWQSLSPESFELPVPLTDPVTLSAAAAVTLTTWRTFSKEEAKFLRALDLSGLAVVSLPVDALRGMAWLERTVLPAGLRVLPAGFFWGCSRLASIDTSGCTALESIESDACSCCRALRVFAFPPTLRVLSDAFTGTSITRIDLSDTSAVSAGVSNGLILEELVLPRRCVLDGANGLPSLRHVTFGAANPRRLFIWEPVEVRFESMTADARFSPGLAGARVYAEVACEMSCETVPFPPP